MSLYAGVVVLLLNVSVKFSCLPGYDIIKVYFAKENKIMIPKDPAMLLSFVNLKLRDFYKDLDSMCEDLDVDKDEIVQKLSAIDYHYDKEQNKFV